MKRFIPILFVILLPLLDRFVVVPLLFPWGMQTTYFIGGDDRPQGQRREGKPGTAGVFEIYRLRRLAEVEKRTIHINMQGFLYVPESGNYVFEGVARQSISLRLNGNNVPAAGREPRQAAFDLFSGWEECEIKVMVRLVKAWHFNLS